MDFHILQPDNRLLVELGSDVWLMDNHKWALLAWDQLNHSVKKSPYSLLHADFHWDGLDDLADQAPHQEFLELDTAALKRLICENTYIRYDSFIAAAIRRNLLSEVHFYCLEQEDEDIGLDLTLRTQYGVSQFIHPNVTSFADAVPKRPLIFDLCLDLFNNSNAAEYEGEIWLDEEVINFLDAVEHHIRSAEIVTVSLSFGYSGTVENTRHLASIVIPRVIAIRAR